MKAMVTAPLPVNMPSIVVGGCQVFSPVQQRGVRS